MQVAFIGAGSMGREHAKAFRFPTRRRTRRHLQQDTVARAEGIARGVVGSARFATPLRALAHDTVRISSSSPYRNSRCGPVVAEAVRYPWALLIESLQGMTYQMAETDLRRQCESKVHRNGGPETERWYSSTRAALEDTRVRELAAFHFKSLPAISLRQPSHWVSRPSSVANYM